MMADIAILVALGAGLAIIYLLWHLAKVPGAQSLKGSKLPPV